MLWAALAISALWGPRAAAEPEGPDPLVAVLEAFAASGTVRAEFVETRRISLLTRGIESEGELYFAPASGHQPERLARHTWAPAPASLVVRGDIAEYADATGTRRLDLRRNTAARALVGNLGALLRGDRRALEEHYRLSFVAEANGHDAGGEPGTGWQLVMRPRDGDLAALVDRVEVRGRDGRMLSLHTYETNGDHSDLRFGRVETGLSLSAAEAARVFSVEEYASPETLPGTADTKAESSSTESAGAR